MDQSDHNNSGNSPIHTREHQAKNHSHVVGSNSHYISNGSGSNSVSPTSSIISVVSAADYAPSPNTCQAALARANQVRVQSILRQLLVSDGDHRINLMRLLRKLLRQMDHQLSWLTQVDLLEAIERLLREETERNTDWRLLNDSTQLLMEALPRLPIEPDWHSIEPILSLIIENLGHQRSELRRSSLLLVNFLVNHYQSKADLFQRLLRLFIERGLANSHNEQAQRGAILSLPLLMSKHTVQGHNLLPLVECLAELLVGAQSRLFYSLFLALQRIHQTLGERQFSAYLDKCPPEARLLYLQAASRNNSIASDAASPPVTAANTCQVPPETTSRRGTLVSDADDSNSPQQEQQQLSCMNNHQQLHQNPRQVTFGDQQEHAGEQEDAASQSFHRPEGAREGEAGEDSRADGTDSSSPATREFHSSAVHSDDERSLKANELGDTRECADSRNSHQEVESSVTTEYSDTSNNDAYEPGRHSDADGETHAELRRGVEESKNLSKYQQHRHEPGSRSSMISDTSSTCSSEAHLVNPAHYMNKAALEGHPMDDPSLCVRKNKLLQDNGCSQLFDSLAINTVTTCCSPLTVDLGGPAHMHSGNELRFGIFPKHLIQVALSPPTGKHHHQDKLEALNEMMCIIRESPINHLAILTSYLEPFIEQFLARLLENPSLTSHQHYNQPTSTNSVINHNHSLCTSSNYQSGLVAIDMIETIVIKTKLSTLQYVRPMVQLLVRALADSRSFYRDNTIRVIHKLMAYLPPQHVIDALFEHKHHKSAIVREQLVDRVTGAILSYDKQEFNLIKLCYHILPMLADHHSSVRLAALECIASLAHALGPDRIGTLLTAAEAVQTGCDYDGFLDAIQARLMRRTLPRCNSDGSIRHVLRPFLNQAHSLYHQEHKAADVRWVKEAPSTHQHINNHGPHANHAGPSCASSSDHEPALHAHRPGVYSPTVGVELLRNHRRLSMVGARHDSLEAGGQHAHHHELHKRQHKRQDKEPGTIGSSPESPPNGVARQHHPDLRHQSKSDPVAEANTRERQSIEGDLEEKNPISENNSRRKSVQRQKSLEIQRRSSNTTGDQYKSYQDPKEQQQNQVRAVTKTMSHKQKPELTRKDSSNSSDSTNSTLPSDSLIYTDSIRAYELSKYRSRQQQTSIDYGIRYPVDPIPISTDHEIPKLQQYHNDKQTHEHYQNRNDITPCQTSVTHPSGMDQQQHQKQRQSQKLIAQKRLHRSSISSGESTRRKQSSGGQSVDGPDRDSGSEREGSEGQKRREEVQEEQQLAQEKDESEHQNQARARRQTSKGSIGHHQETSTRDSDSRRRRSMAGNNKEESSPRDNEAPRDSTDLDNNEATSEDGTRRRRGSKSEDNTDQLVRETSASTGDKGEKGISRQQSQKQQSSSRSQSLHQSSLDEAKPTADPTTQRKRSDQEREQELESLDKRRSSSGKSQTTKDHASAEKVADDSYRFTNEDPPVRKLSQRERSGRARERKGSESDLYNDEKDPSHGEHEISSHADYRPRKAKSQPPARNSASRSGSSEQEDHQASFADESITTIKKQQSASEITHKQAATNNTQQTKKQSLIKKTPTNPRLINSHNTHKTVHNQHEGGSESSSSTIGFGERRAISVSPGSINGSMNIRHILETVAETEGPFQEPTLALRVALDALEGNCWSTKVEGILAIIRLASHHPQLTMARQHELICKVAEETKNLRSTVSRSAIFALGDFSAKLGRAMEPELDRVVQALLFKATENTAFIKDDIRRAFNVMLEHLTQWRLANSLINHGANHKNLHVRRMASQFIAALVQKMGPAKCLVGSRDISSQLLPAAAKFAQDSSPQTRYYGRHILCNLMQHAAFDRLMRKNLTPSLYRSSLGIIESIKRRGPGEPPSDL